MHTCVRHLAHRKRRATVSIGLLRQAGQRWTTASSRGILQGHPLLWNAGRDTVNLPVLGVVPASLRHYRFTPPCGPCHPRNYSWPKRNTSTALREADASGAPCRPAGQRPDPGCAGASDGMARSASPEGMLSKGVYRKGIAHASDYRDSRGSKGNRRQHPHLRAFQSPFTPVDCSCILP
jgi:hypothetical protein